MQILKDGHHAGWRAYDIAATWWNRENTQEAEKWGNNAVDVWKEVGSKHEEAVGLRMLGMIAEQKNDCQAAEELYKQALAIWRERNNQNEIALALNDLGGTARYKERYDEAEKYYLEAIEKTTSFSNKAFYTANLGVLEAVRRNWQNARKWYGEALHISTEIGLQQIIAGSCHGLAQVEEATGQYPAALVLAEKALKIREQLQDGDLPLTRNLIARLKEKIVENKA